MAGFDQDVTVQITIGAPSIGQSGFGTPMWATFEVGAGFTERIRFYTTVEGVDADGDLLTAAADALKAALTQNPRVDRVALGRVALVSLAADLALIRAESDDWYAMGIDDVTDAHNTTAATFAEANGKLFIGETEDPDTFTAAVGISGDLRALGFKRTGMIGQKVPGVPQYRMMRWAGLKLAANPDSSSTVWSKIGLAGTGPDGITESEKIFAELEVANIYTTFKGIPVMGPGRMVNGEPIDNIIAQDWTAARIEERAAQVLADASARNSKIPYTDAGIQVFANVVLDVLSQGQLVGHFNPDVVPIVTGPNGAPLKRSAVPAQDIIDRIVRIEFEVELAGAIDKAAFVGVLIVAA